MAPSTSTPIEMAIPASDMMLALRPMRYMGMKASATDTGMVTMGTIAEGMCQRKTRMTRRDDDHLLDQLVLHGLDGAAR